MDVLTEQQRHKNMAAIKSCDTKIELLLRKALWKNSIRYRKNCKYLPGKPDIAITRYKIAIFCDGDFWHGREFYKREVKTNTRFWHDKIKRNMERDLQNTILLRDMKWVVIRFWGSEIKRDVDKCVKQVLELVEYQRNKVKSNMPKS